MESQKFNIYYLHQWAPIQVGDAAPFSTLNDVMLLDAKLFEWCSQIEQRFPKGALELPGAFQGTIPATMEHIFAPPSVPWTPEPTQQLQGKLQHTPLDPDQDISRSQSAATGIFERISGAPAGRRGALKPYPTFEKASGTYVDVCFAHACVGMSCRNRSQRCPRAHLSVASTRTAPRQAWAGVRAWLQRPDVSPRVRLT